jgi:hypothetical protein
VGYSAADVSEILVDTWNYLQCTTTGDASDPSRVDVFALNSYSWCGESSFQTSGYNVLFSDFSNTSVPMFFSEYGCNVPAPRIFTEVPVIYGPLMTPVFSGGIVYEYSEESNDYGLVNINSDASAQLLPDFNTLQSQFNTLNITALQRLHAQNTSIVPPTCTASLITGSDFDDSFTLPAVPPGAQDLINNGIANPNKGKLAAVTSTKVTQQVKNVSGTVIQGLAITPLAEDQSNTPSGESEASSTSPTSGPTPSPTSLASLTSSMNKKKSAAVGVRANWNSMILSMVLLAISSISLL